MALDEELARRYIDFRNGIDLDASIVEYFYRRVRFPHSREDNDFCEQICARAELGCRRPICWQYWPVSGDLNLDRDEVENGLLSGDFDFIRANVLMNDASYPSKPCVVPKAVIVPKPGAREKYDFEGCFRLKTVSVLGSNKDIMADIRELDESIGLSNL